MTMSLCVTAGAVAADPGQWPVPGLKAVNDDPVGACLDLVPQRFPEELERMHGLCFPLYRHDLR